MSTRTPRWFGRRMLAGLAFAVVVGAAGGCGRHAETPQPAGGHDHGHDHDHDHGAVRTPGNVAQLVGFVREHAAAIAAAVQRGSVAGAADDAHAIADLAADAGKLALGDLAVPREKVRDVNVAGKELAAAADALHAAADAGKLEDVRKALPAVDALIAKLAAAGAVVDGWICPMRCEPGKVYDKPGICAVCRMALARPGDAAYSVMVTAISPALAPGKPLELKVELFDPAGKPVGGIKTVHEHTLHAMTVTDDLSWYSHDHPERQPDGSFKLALTLPQAGPYTIFADFTPEGEGADGSPLGQQIASASLELAGPPPRPPRVPLVEDIDAVKDIDGYRVRMRCNGGPFMAGRDEIIRYGISVGETTVSDLEPIMGALGHLVIISDDLKTFVHSHPLNDEVKGGASATGGAAPAQHSHDHAGHAGSASPAELMARAAAFGNGTPSDPVFHVVFPGPGLYKSFAQFKHNGKVITLPYTIEVKPGTPGGSPGEHKHDQSTMGGAQ